MAVPDEDLIAKVRDRLAELGDPAKAEPMRAYMKSTLPFRGVQRPELRRACERLYTEHALDDRAVWDATVRTLFDDATFREERYAAVELVGHKAYHRWQDVDTLRLYDHLVVTGGWWDYVDELASRGVGPILRADPVRVTPVLLAWAEDPDIWRRRTAILAQLRSKAETDTELLTACIAPSLGENEFFLRKAIGWALREYARTDPDWVRAYVDALGDRISPLSRREALRRLGGSV